MSVHSLDRFLTEVPVRVNSSLLCKINTNSKSLRCPSARGLRKPITLSELEKTEQTRQESNKKYQASSF